MRLATVAALTAVALGVAPALAEAGQGLCARFGAVEETGTVAEGALTEISGLSRSDAHPGVLWTHNDSGDEPRLFALAADGSHLGTYGVPGAEAVDWEDLATGPGPDPGRSYLYVADIGDNDARRSAVTVYRVPEPAERPTGAGGTLPADVAIELRYPSGPVDAEALLVDPRTGDLVVVTKSFTGTARVLDAPAQDLADGSATLRDVGEVRPGPLAAVTAGDVSPDGSLVLLRTYTSVLAYPRAEGASVADALLGDPCGAPQGRERQGETVAVTADGSAYLTVSEGEHPPLHRVAIGDPAATSTTTVATSPTTTPTAAAPPADGSSGDRVAAVAAVLAVVVVAGALAGGRAWRGRRR